jgi:hypothetical protein
MFGMMVGTVTASIPEIILMANWLIEGNFNEKWKQLKSNKVFWAIISIYLLHIISLFYSQNLNFAINDLKIKLPMLTLPIVYFSTTVLSKKEFTFSIICFIGGTFINTTWCYIYSYLLNSIDNVRDVSRFMSHIRLGMFINMAIIFCWYLQNTANQIIYKIIFLTLITYFILSFIGLGLTAGIGFFTIIVFIFIINLFKNKVSKIKLISSLVTIIISIFLSLNYFLNFKTNYFVVKNNPINFKLEKTKLGNVFYHDSTHQVENGFVVNMNVNQFEVQNYWNKKYLNDTFNINLRHNLTRYYVLSRYLASKGLATEASSIDKLTPNDILYIQKNITNVNYNNWNFIEKRFYELIWDITEFKNRANINGHSFSMRLYYWRVALHLIKHNYLIGIGIGDVTDKIKETYNQTNILLNNEWKLRPHQQFLTITVGLGIIGLIIFIISLFYPLITLRKQLHTIYILFFIILISSFLFEDTLETLAGVCYYAVFNSILLSYYSKKN